MKNIPSWLEKAVFYEIYPQSFCDSNGDGIGDIPGIEKKLDYIQSLGINALWLNPCFESTFMDAGYDISDYYKVAPRYGTNDDLRRLFVEARKRDIRILLDLVVTYTSMQHPWFKASSKSERNEYSDLFIWTDSVWVWDVPGLRLVSGFVQRDACYVANFFSCQPALNYGFANPDPNHPWQQSVDAPGPKRVRQEVRNIMKFWMDMGASGFRVDMAGALVKNDIGGKKTAEFWRGVRTWLDRDYPEAVLVSEWSNPAVTIVEGGFHMDFLLHFASPGYISLFRKNAAGQAGADKYGFSFFDRNGHGNIRQFVDEYLAYYTKTKEKGFIALVTGNHDMVPRLGDGRNSDDLALAFLFILTMPGVPFIYYGDEIGMQTVHGLPSKEGGFGRTAVRTPMQWDNSRNAGFSTASKDELYLPIDSKKDRPNVANQESDNDSLLNRVKKIIALRKGHPALCADGDFVPVYAENGKYPFVYRRTKGEEDILIAVNPSASKVEIILPKGLITAIPKTLYGIDKAFTHKDNNIVLNLPKVSGGIYRIN